jgi:hypothetical protein
MTTVNVGSSIGPIPTLTLIPGSTGTNTSLYQGTTFFVKCNGVNSGNFNFSDNNQSTYPSGTTQTILWGDGGTLVGSPLSSTFNHVYSGMGIYNLSYTVTFPNGCTATTNSGVYIGGGAPGLGVNNAALSTCLPGDYSFSLITSGQLYPGTTYQILFNDGSPSITYVDASSIPSTIYHVFDNISCGVTSSVNNTSYPNSYSIQATASVAWR